MTKIGYIITELPIPDDVIGVTDCDGDEAVLNPLGHWHAPKWTDFCTAGPSAEWCGVRLADYLPLTVTAVRGADPLVLTLPEVPDGAIALIGNLSGRRWTRYEGLRSDGIEWQYRPTDAPWSLASILNDEPDGVTVEMVPPCEPRVWPKIHHDEGERPDVVDVEGSGRWVLVTDDGLYRSPLGRLRTLAELRALGDVTEVLDA